MINAFQVRGHGGVDQNSFQASAHANGTLELWHTAGTLVQIIYMPQWYSKLLPAAGLLGEVIGFAEVVHKEGNGGRQKGIRLTLHCDIFSFYPGSNFTPIPFFLADTKMKSTSARQQKTTLWCSRRCVPWILAGTDHRCLQPFSPFCPYTLFARAVPRDLQVKNYSSHFWLKAAPV